MDLKLIPHSAAYREGWDRTFGGGGEHFETTAGVDMDAWSHVDSPSMPVQPVRVGFEPLREGHIPFLAMGVGDDGLHYYKVILPDGVDLK